MKQKTIYLLLILFYAFAVSFCSTRALTFCGGDPTLDPDNECLLFPPQKLYIDIAANAYKLAWDAVTPHAHYKWQEAAGLHTGWDGDEQSVGIGSTSVLMRARSMNIYRYRVRSCNPDGCGAWSAELQHYEGPRPPDQVTVAITNFSAKKFTITWNAATEHSVILYKVIRCITATHPCPEHERIELKVHDPQQREISDIVTTSPVYYSVQACTLEGCGVTSAPAIEAILSDGSNSAPFIVKNYRQLLCMGRSGVSTSGVDCSNYSDWQADQHYKLGADIDASASCPGYDGTNGQTVTCGANQIAWVPLGNCGADGSCLGNRSSDDATFKGSLDGGGFVIRNLYYYKYDNGGMVSEYGGLFGAVENGLIKNLALINIYIDLTAYSPTVGSLAAWITKSNISNSYATGVVTASRAQSTAGGLIGFMHKSSITNSYAAVTVLASTPTVFAYAGGLVGQLFSGGIGNSYATGMVTAVLLQVPDNMVGDEAMAGGLVAFSVGANIRNSYAAGVVSAAGYTGGFIGTAFNGWQSIGGRNYYVDRKGINGIGGGSCAAEICLAATGADIAARRKWLQTQNESNSAMFSSGTSITLNGKSYSYESWDNGIWGDLTSNSRYPCLKGITPGCQ